LLKYFIRTFAVGMKNRLFFFFSVVVLFVCLSQHGRAATVGNDESHNLVFDFQRSWYVYDEGYESYVPFIAERHFGIPAHVVFCNLEENLDYDLLIKCEEKGNFLFIEGALKRKIPANKWLVIPVSSLYKAYGKKKIYLTIYGSKDINKKSVVIGHKIATKVIGTQDTNKGAFQILPRSITPFQSSLSLLFIITLSLFAYLSSYYNRAFVGFFNFMGPFTMYSREQSLFANQALSRTNVLFIILLSLVVSLIYLLLQSIGINLLSNRWFMQDGETVGILLANFFRLSILFFAMFIVKYFFLSLLGGLFNLSKIIDLHYFKLIQTSIVFFSLAVITLLSLILGKVNMGSTISELFVYILAAFYTMRTVIIFLTINRTMPIQVLYLISYLCIVEILPIVIGIRLVL
jgi:hypothetical protein